MINEDVFSLHCMILTLSSTLYYYYFLLQEREEREGVLKEASV